MTWESFPEKSFLSLLSLRWRLSGDKEWKWSQLTDLFIVQRTEQPPQLEVASAASLLLFWTSGSSGWGWPQFCWTIVITHPCHLSVVTPCHQLPFQDSATSAPAILGSLVRHGHWWIVNGHLAQPILWNSVLWRLGVFLVLHIIFHLLFCNQNHVFVLFCFLPSRSILDFLRASATFISITTVHSTFSSVKISVGYWFNRFFQWNYFLVTVLL